MQGQGSWVVELPLMLASTLEQAQGNMLHIHTTTYGLLFY